MITMMIGGGVIFVLFGLVAIINFALIFKGITNRDAPGVGNVLVHLGAPALSGLGFLSLVAGFIWYLVDTYAKG